MNKEDYFKYYIQGSDHYLISKDIFNELFDKMESWKHDTQKYKEIIDKVIDYIEYNNETLYTYEPDYDYEENIVDNYDISSYREDLLEILRGEENK